MNTKEFLIKENDSFRLKLLSNNCLAPRDLKNIHFVREELHNGEITSISVYEFFLYPEEISALSKCLMQI